MQDMLKEKHGIGLNFFSIFQRIFIMAYIYSQNGTTDITGGAAAGRVGIGSTSPRTTLEVNGDILADTKVVMGYNQAYIKPASVERIAVNSAHSLSSAIKVEIGAGWSGGGSQVKGAFVGPNDCGESVPYYLCNGTGGKTHVFSGYYNSDSLVVTSDGNVGVGNTTPQTKLDVNGTLLPRKVVIGSSLGTGPNDEALIVSDINAKTYGEIQGLISLTALRGGLYQSYYTITISTNSQQGNFIVWNNSAVYISSTQSQISSEDLVNESIYPQEGIRWGKFELMTAGNLTSMSETTFSDLDNYIPGTDYNAATILGNTTISGKCDISKELCCSSLTLQDSIGGTLSCDEEYRFLTLDTLCIEGIKLRNSCTDTEMIVGNQEVLINGGSIVVDQNLESTSAINGLILRSPDNNRWRIKVSNAGVLEVALA